MTRRYRAYNLIYKSTDWLLYAFGESRSIRQLRTMAVDAMWVEWLKGVKRV